MSVEYEADLLKGELNGHTVISVEVWYSGNRITIKTREGAYITFVAQLKNTPSGIFAELKKEIG